MICWKYTLHIFSQNALYFVPSLIFNHFLLNILKIIKPLCPNNSHSPLPTMGMKKIHFSVLKHPLYHFWFKYTHTNSIDILHCKQIEKYPNNIISKLGKGPGPEDVQWIKYVMYPKEISFSFLSISKGKL